MHAAHGTIDPLGADRQGGPREPESNKETTR